jgi:hypothetical protein
MQRLARAHRVPVVTADDLVEIGDWVFQTRARHH